MKIKVRQPDNRVRGYVEKNELGVRVTTPSGAAADLEYAGICKHSLDRCAAGLSVCGSPTAMKHVLSRFAGRGFKYEYA